MEELKASNRYIKGSNEDEEMRRKTVDKLDENRMKRPEGNQKRVEN